MENLSVQVVGIEFKITAKKHLHLKPVSQENPHKHLEKKLNDSVLIFYQKVNEFLYFQFVSLFSVFICGV